MAEASFNPATQRLAVVTGANRGIGLEICRQLASEGIMVILTARDEKKGIEAVENLKNSGLSTVIFHQLDVQDSTTIAALANFIHTQFGKLDILVNNARIIGAIVDIEFYENYKFIDLKKITYNSVNKFKKQMYQDYDMVEECLATNYYGLKGVTEALIPLLKLSDSARIVNISSSAGNLKMFANEDFKKDLRDSDNLTEERLDEWVQKYQKDFKEDVLEAKGWPSVYNVSKAVVDGYTRILAKKFRGFYINSVNPGFVKTDINFNNGYLSVEEGAKGPVMLALLSAGGPSRCYFEQTEISTFDGEESLAE